MFGQMGRAAGQLSAEAMLKLLDQRNRPEAMVGSINVAGAVMERMSDDVGLALRRRTRSSRSAARPSGWRWPSRRWCPTPTASGSCSGWPSRRCAASEGPPEGFAEMWQRVEGMLTSYSDEKLRLGAVRARAVGRAHPRGRRRAHQRRPARTHRDLAGDGRRCRAAHARPPAAARSAEHRSRPARWRDIAETATAHAEDLVRVGYFDQAWQLADAVVREGQRDPARTAARLGRARALRPRHHDEARARRTCAAPTMRRTSGSRRSATPSVRR